jgi:hypothetical protein
MSATRRPYRIGRWQKPGVPAGRLLSYDICLTRRAFALRTGFILGGFATPILPPNLTRATDRRFSIRENRMDPAA